jgi:outer membrane protein OmpA-like peptidoglycan-associated protein
MKKTVIALVIGSLLAAPAYAGPRARSQKEEGIGVGAGAAIGALAGGPVGLVLGVAFGGWLGDRMHQEKAGRALAEERAGEADAKSKTLQARLSSSDRKAAVAEAELAAEQSAHRRDVQQALAVDLLFRTEQGTLDAAMESKLAQFAAVVAPLDGAVVRVEGHADMRGTERYNDALSAARAASVRDALVRDGVPAERIVVSAAGKSGAAAGADDADGMAFDRRVAISVVGAEGAGRVAQEAAR